MHRIMGIWNLKTERNMAIDKYEQLRQAAGGFKKSDTLSRFKHEVEHRDSRKKSQLIALKILRTLRKRGLSQKQFAEQLNVSPQQVSKWVKGSENFTLETIEKIEKALGVTLIAVAAEEAVAVSAKTIVTSGAYHQVSTGGLRLSHSSGTIKRTRAYSLDKQYA